MPKETMPSSTTIPRTPGQTSILASIKSAFLPDKLSGQKAHTIAERQISHNPSPSDKYFRKEKRKEKKRI